LDHVAPHRLTREKPEQWRATALRKLCRGTIRTMPNTNVLFVDMLGFADLLEDEGSDVDDLDPIYKGSSAHGPSPAPNFLKHRFINFHRCLNTAREQLQRERTGTVIIFSDSAFFQVDSPTHILSVARRLMFDLISNTVPARMGIAYGSFKSLRYMNDMSTQAIFHVSQFLGTAVSRAVFAEKAASGLRIFVHPKFDGSWDDTQGRLALPVAELDAERNDGRAASELNYLAQIYSEERAQRREPSRLDQPLRNWLTEMADSAEEKAYPHYNDTYAAWNRMRAHDGLDPFTFPEFPWK
jgi:hypothetical protein